MIGWYKQDRKSAKNLDLKYDDEKLEDLPYFIKNSSQLDIEKILKDIKEENTALKNKMEESIKRGKMTTDELDI